MERNVNEIKEKLRSLGYLEWRIGDFFVGRKPKFLFLISKISFIGAILFGFGFTFLYLVTNLPLISNFFDLFLLFLYISVSIFLIFFVFFLILGLIINYPLKKLRLKAKPSNALFQIITILFSILIMGYLFFWLKGQVYPSIYYFFIMNYPFFF